MNQVHLSFRHVTATAAVLCLFPLVAARAADWPRFRGPNGAGIAADTKVPDQWGDQKNLRWKLELPGAGFSSPIVVGNRVLVTCYTGSAQDRASLKRYLVCVDRNSGKVLWQKVIPATAAERSLPGFATSHGFASETPISDGERVYVLFGNTGVLAFDLEGKQLWQAKVGEENAAMYGSATSPILYQDKVIIAASTQSAAFWALDKMSGKEVWKIEAGSLSRSYATPVIAKNAQGKNELVASAPGEAWGLDPETGDLIWYAETGVDTAACPSPVAHGDMIYVIGGRRGARAAIRVGGKDDATKTHVVWRENGGSYVPSPVLYEGHLYWVDQQGIANCIDAKTGKEVTRQRLGGKFYASLVLVDGKLYAVSRFSGTHVLEASPKLTQLAHNKLSDESDFSASPAVSDGQLFLRSDKFLYCIQNSGS